MGTDCIGSCKSNYHTITTTTAPLQFRKLIHHYERKNRKLCIVNKSWEQRQASIPLAYISMTAHIPSRYKNFLGFETSLLVQVSKMPTLTYNLTSSVFAKVAESYTFYFLFFILSLNYMTVDNYWRLEWQPQQFPLYWWTTALSSPDTPYLFSLYW